MFTLGKQERLKSRKLIDRLFREGKNFSVFPYRVYYVCGEQVFKDPGTDFPVAFGVGVGTRHFKKAVDRNRIKRLGRESYRLQKLPLYEALRQRNLQMAVFFLYTARELPAYGQIYEKIGVILERLVRELPQSNPGHTTSPVS